MTTWNTSEFRRAAELTVDHLVRYVEDSQRGLGPAVSRRPTDEVAERLRLANWLEHGGMTLEDFDVFLTDYLDNTTRMHHPGYIAHQNAVPDIPAALAELIQGVTNNPMGLYEMGPAGTTIELAVIDWMTRHLGWEAGTGAGVLTHGGSLANLTALAAARAAAAPDAWIEGVPGDLAILVPPSAHYSCKRAAAIMGLGEKAVVPLETDEYERIATDQLPAALDRVRAAGRRPMALVANACASVTGLYDDLEAIAAFRRERGVWLHVDGAHGASALLSPRHRGLLRGIEHADSVVWDAHKMLRVPGLCAAVLLRRPEHLAAAFHQEASLLFYGENTYGTDLMPRVVECSKSTLGLKVFLNIAWRGARGLGDYVGGQYDRALAFHRLITARPGFVSPHEPQSNIVCFRHTSLGNDDHIALRERLLVQGDFHLSSTEIDGTRYLRLAVMAPSTDEKTVVRLLDAVECAVRDQSPARSSDG